MLLNTERIPIGKNIPENRMREMFKSFKQDVRPNIINDFSGKISLVFYAT